MNKELMMKEKPYYIDVWAVDLLKPLLSSGSVSLNVKDQILIFITNMIILQSSKPSSFFDTTCIFLMQMACVLNMSQTWKKFSKLRIYVVESDQRSLTITEIQVCSLLHLLIIYLIFLRNFFKLFASKQTSN